MIDRLIKHFKLSPHPEGGFFSETYRASGLIPANVFKGSFDGNRSISTAIYFLLPKGEVSHFHRIKSDEIWHFYKGGPLTIVELCEKEAPKQTILGCDIDAGETPQYVVRAGTWFAAFPCSHSEFSFVGCTVAPGFDFFDFELGDEKALLKRFPGASAVIKKLTK